MADRESIVNPIGGDDTRLDARDKVMGKAHYVQDMDLPGMVFAKVLRSPHHHAKIKSLKIDDAASIPGVLRIVTAKEIPGENGFSVYSQDEPILVPVGDTAKMKGAPIALIVAQCEAIADLALSKIEVEYQVLPHTFEASEAISEKNAPIYANGNVLNIFGVENNKIENAFEASDVLLEAEYLTSFQEHAALERESALGYIDEEGIVTIFSGTHEPHWQQEWIANAVGQPSAVVRFITPPIGGSFGGKQDPWPHIVVGILTFLVQRPVCLVFSRIESFIASPKRHPYRLNYKIGATNEGVLTSIRARIDCNTGGYDGDGYHIPEYATVASGGIYRWQGVDIEAKSIYTNGPKCGQFRGFGTPQSTFALECMLDEMVQSLGQDPIAFRLNNAISQEEDSFLGYPVVETLGYAEVLATLKPYYEKFDREVNEYNLNAGTAPCRKGVGVAGMWYRYGKSGSLRVEAQAELTLDGEFRFFCSAPDYGQGISTVMAQIGAEALGVHRGMVHLVNADTGLVPDSGVQGASRATYWVGNAVMQAANTLKDNMFGVAAEMIDCNPTVLTLIKNEVVSTEDSCKRVSLKEVAREYEQLGIPRKITDAYDPVPLFPPDNLSRYTPHFATAAHLAEVEVDLQTGMVRVTRYVAVHDVGKVINLAGAEGQVEGSILMGIGSALKEEYIPGQTTGFSNYILPMIDDMPDIKTIFVEVPSRDGPFGAKGLGETAMLPSTPAIINAVSRAIGTRIRHIPAVPERILKAVRGGVL